MNELVHSWNPSTVLRCICNVKYIAAYVMCTNTKCSVISLQCALAVNAICSFFDSLYLDKRFAVGAR